jgi:hypothetical protein
MRKTLFLLSILFVLTLASCSSEEDRANVCDCEMLYQSMRTEKSFYTASGISSTEADAKVDSAHKTEFANCMKIKEDLGEDTYFKYSQHCGGK